MWWGFGSGGRGCWHDCYKKLRKSSPSCKPAPPFARLEPISASVRNVFKTGSLFGKGILFWELYFVLEGCRIERETTHADTQVSEKGGEESLQGSPFPSACGEMAYWLLCPDPLAFLLYFFLPWESGSFLAARSELQQWIKLFSAAEVALLFAVLNEVT